MHEHAPSPLVGEGGFDAEASKPGEGFSPRMQTPHPSRTTSAPSSSTQGEGKGEFAAALLQRGQQLVGLLDHHHVAGV